MSLPRFEKHSILVLRSTGSSSSIQVSLWPHRLLASRSVLTLYSPESLVFPDNSNILMEYAFKCIAQFNLMQMIKPVFFCVWNRISGEKLIFLRKKKTKKRKIRFFRTWKMKTFFRISPKGFLKSFHIQISPSAKRMFFLISFETRAITIETPFLLSVWWKMVAPTNDLCTWSIQMFQASFQVRCVGVIIYNLKSFIGPVSISIEIFVLFNMGDANANRWLLSLVSYSLSRHLFHHELQIRA